MIMPEWFFSSLVGLSLGAVALGGVLLVVGFARDMKDGNLW